MSAPWPGPLGPPPDTPSIVVALVALLFLWQGRALFEVLFELPGRFAVWLLAGVALLLSVGYVDHYLRGGPRIIDATSYWLQARALAEGHVTWPIDEPTASFRGRFLLESGTPDVPRLGVIFPPGYPAILALGFLLRSPLFVGPLIAGLLIFATYALAKRVTGRHDVALVAACLSVVSAALRYQTADTMSHGWAALVLTTALALAFHAAELHGSQRFARAALAGICYGWYFATRPVSALALLPAFALACSELAGRGALVVALGALVPALLFALEQRAVTGSFWQSSQSAYYALADGPPGCFRYGFGAGIGCLHEHGSYVASVLPQGLTWKAAAITTLRRLRLHLMDVSNLEPLVLFVVAAPFLALRRRRGARRIVALAIAVAAIILAYAPFYFDGSYPGGGGRLFADVIPIEHVLIATAVAFLLDRPIGRPRSLAFAAAFVCAASMLGFAVHTSFEHVTLRDREGGRPFFEPAVLAEAKVDRGLLFVGTDHAFNLAYDPRARDAARAFVVAREFGDERDRLVWERLGRPPAYRYVFDGRQVTVPVVVPWSPAPEPHPYRFEAEAEWPPIAQSGGWFEPVFARGTCAWGGRLLAVRTTSERPFQGTISFPVPSPGRFRVGIHVASRGEVAARFALQEPGAGPPLVTWGFTPSRRDLMCATLAEEEVNLSGLGLLEVTARGSGELFLDAVALEAAPPVGLAR